MFLESRMTAQQREDARRLFGVPERFYDAADLMVREVEWQLILAMGARDVPDAELRALCLDARLCRDAYDLIRESYHRCIISKAPDAPELTWHISSFYERYQIYAQFESYELDRFPRETIEALYDWAIDEGLRRRRAMIERKLAGVKPDPVRETYLTLDEAIAFLEEHADSIYLHPCNCKSMKVFQSKPVNTCMPMNCRPNSEADRGYGERITLERAKALVREYNARGLMQKAENYGLCNCDGLCCSPLHSGRRLNARGVYPKANYRIDFHAEACVNCGKCVKLCNFGAYSRDETGRVRHDPDKCWGCTICSSNCPTHAIRLIPREE